MTVRWYAVGDGALGIDTTDRALRDRFEQIYGECAVETPGTRIAVTCRISVTSGEVCAEFDDPETLDVRRFAAAALPGHEFTLSASADGRVMRASPSTDWRPMVANLAVGRLQRLQRSTCFFHAASAVVAGSGLMACGPKRSGKTTLAMALGSRGHAVLGDELAALRLASRELLPVRRSLAVRAGPAAAAVRIAMERLALPTELYPDGEPRARMPVGVLFPPAPPAPAPLTTILLLGGFAATPTLTAVPLTPAALSRLTPLGASLWGRPLGTIALQLMRALAPVRIFQLDAGPPDDTARLVEHLLEAA